MQDIKYGEAVRLTPMVSRITAPNPGPLTGPGTNTYIIDNQTVVDPGPAIDSHVDSILRETSGKIENILVTHTHDDHSPAAARLVLETGAQCIGCVQANDGYQDQTFSADHHVKHDDIILGDGFSIEAVHTPGHVHNHFCYLLREKESESGMLFSGDHIMEGSTVVIIPPGGDMADYISSLRILESYPIDAIAPGHGLVIQNPMEWVNYLIEHRLGRERKVLEGLKTTGETTVSNLTTVVYDDVDSGLHGMASLSLWAHLLKLSREGRAKQTNETSSDLPDQIWKLT